MKFLALWKSAQDVDSIAPPPPAMIAEMGQLMQDLTERGSLLDAAGLQPTAKGVRLRTGKGKLTVTDGPFAEAKEVIASYTLLQAASLAEVVELTRPFMELNLRYGYEGELEVRQVFGPEDFTPELHP